MIKKLFIIYTLLFLFPLKAHATECKNGDLTLEFLNVQTFAPTDSYTAQLSGVLEMPNPNYKYDLKIKKLPEGSKSLRANLTLAVKNPNMVSIDVITPIEIDKTVQIPYKARELFIDVIKPFNWGAEYFKAKFSDKVIYNKTICMKAEMYK